MTAYTFYLNKETSQEIRNKMDSTGKDVPIAYLAGAKKRPFMELSDGDELFVVGAWDDCLWILGRLVVDGKPMQRADAVVVLGPKIIEDKKLNKLYVLANKTLLDNFILDLALDDKDVRKLDLYDGEGQLAKCVDSLRIGKPNGNQLRNPLRLSETSVDVLRSALGLPPVGLLAPPGPTPSGSTTPGSRVDDDAYRMQLIKTRRGQAKFRKALLKAYGQRCPITDSAVEDLLEAAHITPHAEQTDYRVSNGLLLRADIHTLFDLNLISIDETYCVQVSPLLQNSEYWSYHRRPLERLPQNPAHHPDRDALRDRTAQLKRT